MADISIQKFEFTKDWNNPTDFSTYQPDETKVRADLQELHNQTRDFINNILLGAVMKVIAENQEYVERAVADAILGEVPDNSIGMAKLACATSALLENDADKLPTSTAVAAYIKNALGSYMNSEEVEAQITTKATTESYMANVDAAWTKDNDGGYYKTVAVEGVLVSDNPIVDVILGEDVEANALCIDAWSLVTRITTDDGSITLYANGDAPATAFTIQLKVVR